MDFVFDTSEYKLLEEIEFDETILRPESVRFYTLEEQVSDAYEKMIPRGRTTKFQLDQLAKDVDKLRDLYTKYIVPTEDKYVVREPEQLRHFPWIFPIYAAGNTTEYDGDSWAALFEPSSLKLPKFYNRMLGSLPKPYASTQEGRPYVLSTATTFLDGNGESPIRALPKFVTTIPERHEDGTFDLIPTPVDGTGDIVNFVGYYAQKRPFEIPNPYPGHPLFASNNAVAIDSTVDLKDLIGENPIDTVMNHAVPNTHMPYTVGAAYLKIYDIKLEDIRWDTWKSRFPPAETVDVIEPPAPIEFENRKADKPGDKLIEGYGTEFYPALSSRYWLSSQLDGGELVVAMLKSNVGTNGTVNQLPGADMEPMPFPKTTLEDCDLTDIDFQELTIRGLLRRTWEGNKAVLTCVPLDFIKQERKILGYKNRKTWKESTPADDLRTYMRELKLHVPIETPIPKIKLEKIPTSETSKQRVEIVAVLEDRRRFADDKLRDIKELTKDLFVENRTIVDVDNKFIVCQHTLALLGGDLAKDRNKYYEEWTTRVDGFRVCKYCGEHVSSDILEDQEEFTDEGRVIKHASFLTERKFSVIPGNAIQIFKDLFDMTKPSDEVFFMLISLLGVVPDVTQTQPILQMGRELAATLKPASQGVVGIAQAILLLQSHVPSLIPKRSFGKRPLVISGYPRDGKPAEFTIVDSMMLVLTKTFEAYPTSFKGSSVTTLRLVLNKPAAIKKACYGIIDQMVENEFMRDSLNRAKAYAPAEEAVASNEMLRADIPTPKMGSILHSPECPSFRVFWTSVRLPTIVQPPTILRSGIDHFKRSDASRKLVEISLSIRTTPVKIDPKEIAKRLKGSTASDNWRINVMLINRIATLFSIPSPVATLDTTQKPAELRDITKGFYNELVSELSKNQITKSKLEEFKKKDILFLVVSADLTEAKKTTNSLKAKERTLFTDRMREMTDADREITKDLIARGLAPYIITDKDRILFAREKEQEEEQQEDVGVGLPVDYQDQGDVPINTDIIERGNYGDYTDVQTDYDQTHFDDGDRGI